MIDNKQINKTGVETMKLFLVAASGDCAAGGMGNANDALEIKKEDYELVKNYMKIQNDYLTESAMMESLDDCHKDTFLEIMNKYWDLMAKMMKKEIFKHKWHTRTIWVLVRGNELKYYAPITTIEG